MSDQDDDKPLPKPTLFDQLYPGEYMKAVEFLGKKPTLTITSIDMKRLETEQGKKIKATVSFRETEKKLVLCKTNGFCIKAMFGPNLQEWLGKRVTLFEDVWNDEPCIRVWGSPDIDREFDTEVKLPRRRPMRKTMHKVVREGNGGRPKEANNAAPAIRGAAIGPFAGKVPTIEEATGALRREQDLGRFLDVKKSLWALYASMNEEVPLDVESAAHIHREDLESRST